jgi:hypothetical protein
MQKTIYGHYSCDGCLSKTLQLNAVTGHIMEYDNCAVDILYEYMTVSFCAHDNSCFDA